MSRSLPIVMIAAAWETSSRTHLVSDSTLPALSSVAMAWIDLLKSGELPSNAVISLYRAFGGLALAVGIGAIFGIAMAAWRPLNLVLSTLLEVMYPIPKSALIPVTAIWLGFGSGSKILLVFLGCLLPVTMGAFNGARATEQVLIWSGKSLGAGRLRVFRDIVLRSALPELFNGIRTAIALSLILVVSSELIVSRDGFGYLIGFLGASGSYDAMFAVVLTTACLGFATDRLFLFASGHVQRWQH
jgi:NitT/TauT family transport system permease protein